MQNAVIDCIKIMLKQRTLFQWTPTKGCRWRVPVVIIYIIHDQCYQVKFKVQRWVFISWEPLCNQTDGMLAVQSKGQCPWPFQWPHCQSDMIQYPINWHNTVYSTFQNIFGLVMVVLVHINSWHMKKQKRYIQWIIFCWLPIFS